MEYAMHGSNGRWHKMREQGTECHGQRYTYGTIVREAECHTHATLYMWGGSKEELLGGERLCMKCFKL